MNHVAVEQFTTLYERMPVRVRRTADHNFGVIKQYPNHPLLRLVKYDGVWSMRVGSRHRALGVEHGDTLIWFWIGTHRHYAALFN